MTGGNITFWCSICCSFVVLLTLISVQLQHLCRTYCPGVKAVAYAKPAHNESEVDQFQAPKGSLGKLLLRNSQFLFESVTWSCKTGSSKDSKENWKTVHQKGMGEELLPVRRRTVVGTRVGKMVLEVLERSLSSDKGLDKESKAGEHSQSVKEKDNVC